MTVNDASLGESGSKLSKVAATSLLMGVTRGSSEAYINKQNEVYCEAAVLDNAAFFIKEDDEYAALCLANAYKNYGLKISPCKLCKHCKVFQDNTQSNLRYYCAADDNLRYIKKMYRYCRLQEFDADEMKVYRYLNYRRNRAITLVQGMKQK